MLQSNKCPFLIPVEALKPRLQPQLPLLVPPLSNLLRLTVTVLSLYLDLSLVSLRQL